MELDTEGPSKPSLSVVELILLNCIVCGLELVASAALVYLPPMLLEAGVQEQYMSWVLGLGPFLCLLVVPIMGRWMDTCKSRFGRRIPFMFTLSLLVLLSLVLIPYADHMVPAADSAVTSKHSMHVNLLALTVILIDFSTQAGLTPCEVFLQDITKGMPIRERAFSLYSLMCSVGSCCGYLILSINWEKTWLGAVFGDQEYCVFSMLFVIFLILMILNLWTASRTRRRQNISSNRNHSYVEMQSLVNISADVIKHSTVNINSGCRNLCQHWLLKFMPEGIRHLFSIPYALRRLVYANFFAWAGVMAFLLFYTDYVGEIVYGGSPSAAVGTVLRQKYTEGVRMGSFGLFLHAIMSLVSALTIEKLVEIHGMRRVHLNSLALFTLCIALILLSHNLVIINILAMITGVAFASMTTIPFSLVGMYHDDKAVSQFIF